MTISIRAKAVRAAAVASVVALLASLLALVGQTPAQSQAQSRKSILVSGPWTAMQTTEKGRRVCYVEGAPTKKRSADKTRGDVYVHVLHRTGTKVRRKTRGKSRGKTRSNTGARGAVEIGFSTGHALRRKGPVLVKIGRSQFRLVANGDKAWTRSRREDRRLLRGMIRGKTMVMRSLSAKGAKFEDTYSLIGFTRAYKAARRACGLK